MQTLLSHEIAAEFAARRDGTLAGRLSTGDAFAREIEVERAILGSGLSGDVRAAKRLAGNMPCAVKTLRTCGLSAAELSLVKNEVKIFLSADHPHIGRLLL